MNYYKILGLSRLATGDEIKKAYRRLAMQYHPDKNPNDSMSRTRFQMVTEAYAILSNPSKKAKYDLENPPSPDEMRPEEPSVQSEARSVQKTPKKDPKKKRKPFRFPQITNFIDELFTDSFQQTAKNPIRGGNLRQTVEIALAEVASGTRKVVPISYWESCEACEGSGVQQKASSRGCRRCNGIGVVDVKLGNFTVKKLCPNCHGDSSSGDIPCFSCNGNGRNRKTRKILVRLKAGLKNGALLKVANQGEPGRNGGPTGDLYLKIRLQKHPNLTRRNDDLHAETHVDFVEAILGKSVKIDSLYGIVDLEIPPGTQPNQTLIIHDQGLPNVDGDKVGDLFVKVKVVLPTQITHFQRKLLDQFYPNQLPDSEAERSEN